MNPVTKDRRLFRRRTRHCKDPYFVPKNLFQPKPREYYEKMTDIRITPEQRRKLERLWKEPQSLVIPDDFLVTMKVGKKPDNLIAFIKSIIPRRRMANDHYIYLIKKKPNNIRMSGNYLLNNDTKDYILPLVFKAIDNGTL